MTKKIQVGSLSIGGGERIKIQSMTTSKTSDVDSTVAQILRLQNAGCDLVRVAILDETDARSLRAIKDKIQIPLVADIHFSANLAVLSVEHGADKIRINPGNIGDESQIKRVADAVKAHGVPVRVGANTGSIEREHLEKYGRTATALVESALQNVKILENYGVNDLVLSVKASSVP